MINTREILTVLLGKLYGIKCFITYTHYHIHIFLIPEDSRKILHLNLASKNGKL